MPLCRAMRDALKEPAFGVCRAALLPAFQNEGADLAGLRRFCFELAVQVASARRSAGTARMLPLLVRIFRHRGA